MKKLLLMSLLMASIGLNAYAQTTETEDNDDLTRADTLYSLPASLTNNTLKASSDKDWFKVYISQAGVLETEIPANSNTFNFRITVYNSSAQQSGTIYCSLAQSYGGSVRVNALVDTGWHYILINKQTLLSGGGNWSGNPYSLNVSLNTSDTCEWNYTLNTAKQIPENDTLKAYLYGRSYIPYNGYCDLKGYANRDFYYVRTSKCGVLRTNITINNIAKELSLDLLDSNGNKLKYAQATSVGGSVSNTIYHKDPAKYIIEVSKADDPNPYILQVHLDTSDTRECFGGNNSLATASPLAICDTITATILKSGDYDYYSFIGDGSTVRAYAWDIPTNLFIGLRLYEDGNYVNDSLQGSAGLWVGYTFQTIAGKKYTIRVRDINQLSNDKIYNFTITNAACGTVGISEAIVKASTVEIYPNPTKGSFNIKVHSKQKERIEITVINLLGKVVKQEAINSNENTKIELNQPSGIYTVNVVVNGEKYVQKLVLTN